MKNSMGKQDVQAVFKERLSFQTRHFVFKKSANPKQTTRVAFAFSRKRGSAVVRNRFKRRIRELARLTIPRDKGIDLLCIAKASLENLSENCWSNEKQKIMGWCESL